MLSSHLSTGEVPHTHHVSESMDCSYGRGASVMNGTSVCVREHWELWANSLHSLHVNSMHRPFGSSLSQSTANSNILPTLYASSSFVGVYSVRGSTRREPGIEFTWRDQPKSLLGYTSNEERVLLELLTLCKINHNWFFLHMHLLANIKYLKILKMTLFQ